MSAVFTPTRARLTVAQFQKMGDAGIMPPETRVELVDGELIEKAPIGPRHMHAVNRLTRAFVAAVGEAAIVSVQDPVALDEHSETGLSISSIAAWKFTANPTTAHIALSSNAMATTPSRRLHCRTPRYAW
ncbi:MAG: Uma2 family endonuclease [Burkholderiales bacterium]|nr:Uma2 family endonuclease [Burkholderiales bacterium]